MVKWTYDKYINQTLNIKTKKKKIWINPEAKLSTHEKRSIICKESNKMRSQRTINELVEVYLQLQQTDQKITQKLLETHSVISINTIKRHWKEINEKVSSINIKEEKRYIY